MNYLFLALAMAWGFGAISAESHNASMRNIGMAILMALVAICLKDCRNAK